MLQPLPGNVPPMRRQMRGPDTRQLDTNGSSSSTKAAARDYGAHEPEFKYRELLLFSLAIPFGIMLAFGGKPSLLMLCFGAIISYIFDLLGSIEVRDDILTFPSCLKHRASSYRVELS